jgi:hypothetical protein
MKNIIFISCILIILFKTGNVLSDNNIFNVNNIEINKENSVNKEILVNKAFSKGFDKLINRLLLEKDYKNLENTNLKQIKELISHYQLIDLDKEKKIKFNIFFDKDRIHNFFFKKNILYSDVINTEVLIFPLLIIDNEHFIYSKNYFINNWNNENLIDLIEYTLPIENIESIQKIEKFKENIFNVEVSEFFKEYNNDNMVFVTIDINNSSAKIFLNTKIQGKSLKKILKINNTNLSKEKFNDKIIIEVKNLIKDLIKSQNLIDVKTPSFLNVEIELKNKINLVEFNNRIKKIDLISNYYVQQLNKDYALVKIKYLGKINKIIKKLNNQKMDLKLVNGKWLLNLS